MENAIEKIINLYQLNTLEDTIHFLKGKNADNQPNKYKVFFETTQMTVVINHDSWYDFLSATGGKGCASLLKTLRKGHEEIFDNTLLAPLIEKEELESSVAHSEKKASKIKV